MNYRLIESLFYGSYPEDMQADVGEGIPKSLCPHLCYLHIRFSQQIERRVFYFLIKAWSLIYKELSIYLILSLLNFKYKIYYIVNCVKLQALISNLRI